MPIYNFEEGGAADIDTLTHLITWGGGRVDEGKGRGDW